MKKALAISLILGVVLAIGCAGPLYVNEAMVRPSQLSAGDDAKILVTFKGPKAKVASVRVIVRENPDITYDLNDNGQNGDMMANDNIWTVQTKVPYDAQPGTYHLDVTARDKEGVSIPGENSQPETQTGPVAIAVTLK